MPVIDITFDVRSDAGGKDPDSHSATLRRYHRLLWSKPLPGGRRLDLDRRLEHRSDLGEFQLSSDAITHTYRSWTRPARLVDAVRSVPEGEVTAFLDLGCTVGGYLVFPKGKRVDGRTAQSINQSRGIHPRIRDRFDLTLECIRRHYLGSDSPLAACLARHDDFFALFGAFRGYVDHFLLQDLVDDGGDTVRFLHGTGDFACDPLPLGAPGDYGRYLERSVRFLRARNRRIDAYATAHLR